jgi:hypothetical protein
MQATLALTPECHLKFAIKDRTGKSADAACDNEALLITPNAFLISGECQIQKWLSGA